VFDQLVYQLNLYILEHCSPSLIWLWSSFHLKNVFGTPNKIQNVQLTTGLQISKDTNKCRLKRVWDPLII
jgi:hypothetical protein